MYSTTYIENWGSGVKRIMEACQKRGVAAPTWSINGGFVVVTFMRPTKGGTQDVTQGVTQEDTLDEKIEKAIKDNPQITTEELAKMSNVVTVPIIGQNENGKIGAHQITVPNAFFKALLKFNL